MTPSKISQPLNNQVLSAQQGGGFVATATFDVGGGDVLIGFSASAWTQTAGEISIELWLDGQPTGGRLAMYANTTAMHLSLGHGWVSCPGLAPGQHELQLIAGEATITDMNDLACVTVWEMGDGCTVRFADDAPCPQGTGQILIKEAVEVLGGQALVSVDASGWATQAGQLVGAKVIFGQNEQAGFRVMANNANQHLAMVGTDLVATQVPRGQQLVAVEAGSATSTDGGDTVHVAVVDWVNQADAPAVLPLNPPLQNAAANAQQGDGGSIATASFESNGGTLLIRSNVSVWTQQTSGFTLFVGIQVDGTSKGFNQGFANFAATHMAMVTNDLVVTGVPAGSHTLNLMGENSVITDQNDSVSVTILEFPQ